MFGWGKRDKPIELIPFAEAAPKCFTALLCDGLTARHVGSFAALFDLHARLQAERPGMRVLVTLNDRVQAEYTSGHAIDSHDLDATDGHDLSGLGPELFEDGRHRGYLTTVAEFPIRLANLRAAAVEIEAMRGVLDWATPPDLNDPVTLNRDAEAALRIDLEKEVLVQFVPVDSAADALAAFPNGYFASDLDPMQSHALARHLEGRYGLALFGVGASVLGFRRAEPFDAATAQMLARDVAGLYSGTPPDGAAALADLLTAKDWLLLRYTES